MRLLLLLVTMVWTACGAPPATDGSAPPPGRSYQEYLAGPEDRPPQRPDDTVEADAMRIHFIDIGQGAAHLVELPCGAILIDTGGEKNEQFDSEPALLAYLDDFFERRTDLDRTLDLLVVTHLHIDHTRSVAAVLRRYQVRNIIDNGLVSDEIGGEPVQWMHHWRQGRDIGYRDVLVDDIGDDGLTDEIIDPVGGCQASDIDPEIRALWGGRLGAEEPGWRENDDSVAIRIDFGDASALFPGDLEQLGIARITRKYRARPDLLDADVYQVAHHGSKHSTAQHFIAAIAPKVAVMSHGPYERYLRTEEEFTARKFGHPNIDAIEQLIHPTEGVRWDRDPVQVWVGLRGGYKERPSEFRRETIDRAIYSTGWDGTVVVTAYGNGWIEVATER